MKEENEIEVFADEQLLARNWLSKEDEKAFEYLQKYKRQESN